MPLLATKTYKEPFGPVMIDCRHFATQSVVNLYLLSQVI